MKHSLPQMQMRVKVDEGGVVRVGSCGRLVECVEVAPVLRYVTGMDIGDLSKTLTPHQGYRGC